MAMALLRREDVEPKEARDHKDHKDHGKDPREPPDGDMGAVLGKGSRFEGKLAFDGTVRIDGDFKGDINSDGKLVVGDNATIEGNVSVGVAVVSGALTGTLRAKTLVELKPHARVNGDIVTAALVIDRGAHFDGTVKMQKA